MRMNDWDTASFEGFQDVIKYFKLEEKFKSFFKKEVDAFHPDSKDRYEENNLINFCLNWLDLAPNILLFSGYNEITGKFDLNQLEIIPKNITDAEQMITLLQEFIASSEKKSVE